MAFLSAPAARAAGGEGEGGLDVRVGAYSYLLTAEDFDGAELSEQVGATIKVKSWGDGWHGKMAFEERAALSGPDPYGHPGETGARLTTLEGTVHALGMEITGGRFHGPSTLGHLVLDGVSASKGVGEGLTATVFGGRMPLTPDLGHIAKDQGEAYGATVRWQPSGQLNAEVAGTAGRRLAVLGSNKVSDPVQTKAFAARMGWRASSMLTVSGAVQAGDRIRLRVRNVTVNGLSSATEDVDVVDMDLFTAYVRANLRLSKTLRLGVSGQRLQARIFRADREDSDAFHDVAARARWRFWGPASLTVRMRRRLRQGSLDDADRLSGFVSLDDALADGMILNGGVTQDTGDGFDKTRSNAELGWRMDVGGDALFEAAGTFTWIRRDNGDGDDNGYSAASLTDADDPVSAFALALAPNDTVGLRATWLSGGLFVTGDAARDLASKQTWAFLHAGLRWR